MSAKEVNELVRQAAIKALQETDAEPEPELTHEVQWPVQVSIGKGLEGAISNTTKIGYVNGAKGWLIYRGYNCFDLAEKSSYEETTYLLLFGKLPTRKELGEFSQKLVDYRPIPKKVLDVLYTIPTRETHPMSALRTAVSVLGTLDRNAEDTTVEAETEVSIKLIAQMATIAAAIARLRQGKDPVEPDSKMSHAKNFLYMMTGQEPDELYERIMDIALILHADHGMNASTFTTMVINSSLSDMYSSVVGGIGSLKGPLHGGANERVLYQLEEIGNPENVESWFRQAREKKVKIMGFGHRVYKAYDPRARIFGPIARLLAEKNPAIKNLYETAAKLEEVVCAELGKEKKIFPNVDFYSGIIYKAMGIETAMFTPIFAVSRVAGWTARALEYLSDNRIFRPRAVYTGPIKMDYVPIDQRK
ncbi:MAG: citrate synthase [Calditrichaeota bacterium]|nr:MAG: citrate synthase [Calditrichota bacterium]